MTNSLNIVYQDDDHAVVLKDAGMSTHGRGRLHLSALLARSIALPPGKPVHRLDRNPRTCARGMEFENHGRLPSQVAFHCENVPQLVLRA